jgi:cytochrome c-type biogenesis protein CcmE
MKISYLFWIGIIGIAIAILISTSGSAGSYTDFAQADEAAQDGSSKSFHVAGKLVKQNGKIVGLTYDPLVDPNYCSFQLTDQKGEVRRVVYLQPKPQDIERSDVIVVVGKAQGNDFVADHIILKCPSKYQENKDPFKDAAKAENKTSLL